MKSKTLVLSTDLDNSSWHLERPWIEKLTGILSGSPLLARIKDGLSNGGAQLLVNTRENEKKKVNHCSNNGIAPLLVIPWFILTGKG